MSILSGSTFLNDIGQRWGVTSTASKADRAMRRLIDGSISKNEAILVAWNWIGRDSSC